jgi:hypothetical protein
MEVLWIVALGTRKHALVDELVDGLAFHDEGESNADVGRVDEKKSLQSVRKKKNSQIYVVEIAEVIFLASYSVMVRV